MKPGDLADKIEGIIVAASERLGKQITSVQERLYSKLVVILKSVETDVEGYIVQSADNRRVLTESVNAIEDAFRDSSAYHRAISSQIEVIPELDSLNAAYFEDISAGFVPNRVFIKNIQRNIIQNMENALLNDGLQVYVKTPLIDILNRNISIGGNYSGFLKEVRDFVIGGDNEAKLLKHTRTYLSDALFKYARSWQESVTADLKLDWYNYNGGLIKDSREFCRDRAGGFFHRKEIESWASLEWQGKNPATTKSSIFVFLGGWSCRHSAIPVHESIVPKIDIDRARDFGFIK